MIKHNININIAQTKPLLVLIANCEILEGLFSRTVTKRKKSRTKFAVFSFNHISLLFPKKMKDLRNKFLTRQHYLARVIIIFSSVNQYVVLLYFTLLNNIMPTLQKNGNQK